MPNALYLLFVNSQFGLSTRRKGIVNPKEGIPNDTIPRRSAHTSLSKVDCLGVVLAQGRLNHVSSTLVVMGGIP